MLQKIIVCLIAGAGAGFGTGLAGMSAAAVIAPMLVTFLQVKSPMKPLVLRWHPMSWLLPLPPTPIRRIKTSM